MELEEYHLSIGKRRRLDRFLYKLTKHKTVSLVLGFVSRYRIAICLILSFIFILLVIYGIVPKFTVGTRQIVNPGVEFRLENGENAKLKFANFRVEIVNFLDSNVCPEGQVCFKGDDVVEYIVYYRGKKYAVGSASSASIASTPDYEIVTQESDYKSYAILKIVKRPKLKID